VDNDNGYVNFNTDNNVKNFDKIYDSIINPDKEDDPTYGSGADLDIGKDVFLKNDERILKSLSSGSVKKITGENNGTTWYLSGDESYFKPKDGYDGAEINDYTGFNNRSGNSYYDHKVIGSIASNYLNTEVNNFSNDRLIDGDPILSLDVEQELNGDLENQIIMSFEDVRSEQTIYLRPTIESISDGYQVANGGEEGYIGRTEMIPEYQRTTRTISLSFTLYATTPKEYLINSKKMMFLKSLIYPKATSKTNFSTIKNPIFRFSLGDQYVDLGGVINSLQLDPDVNGAWETAPNYRGAKIINSSLSFTVIHDEMPMLYDGETFEDQIGAISNGYMNQPVGA